MDRYEETLDAIEQLICGEQLAKDGRLPTERELSDKLGIGRRVLRRALSTLEQNGKIVRHQGRGTFVAGRSADEAPASAAGEVPGGSGSELLSLLDTANPVELVELRLALEPVMCRLAALRSSRLDVARLRRQAELTSQADNYQAYQEADMEFHRMIGELSRNSVFVELQAVLSTALRDTALERFGENGHCFKRQAEHVAFHRRIVEAIAERDTNGAERLMQEHLGDVHRSIFADVVPVGSTVIPSDAAD
ncbi:MAG: FadR/GntR family transcriptional regulator [Pseudomonadota bacterium]